jgi:hypothetical protein
VREWRFCRRRQRGEPTRVQAHCACDSELPRTPIIDRASGPLARVQVPSAAAVTCSLVALTGRSPLIDALLWLSPGGESFRRVEYAQFELARVQEDRPACRGLRRRRLGHGSVSGTRGHLLPQNPWHGIPRVACDSGSPVSTGELPDVDRWLQITPIRPLRCVGDLGASALARVQASGRLFYASFEE